VTVASVVGRGTKLLDLTCMGLVTVDSIDRYHTVGKRITSLEFATCLELSVDPWHLMLVGDRRNWLGRRLLEQ
jgi:hypothetical protein